MNRFEAKRMVDIPFSSIRAIFEEVAARRGRGEQVVSFHIGRPDFDTPEHVKEAAKRALDEGLVTYTSNYGLPELREAIAAKMASDNSMIVNPDTQLIVTIGANEAIFITMLGLLNPGDEVLVPDPMWLHYRYCVHLAGARVISVPLRESNGFQLDPQVLEDRITKRTRMVVLNTPHNPTGVVFSRETVEAVADIADRHDLLLLSDEIYSQILYDDAVHVSPGAIPQVADRTITVSGFSKAYAMTGWRLGYVVASPEIIKILIRVHQYSAICATSFAQAGAIAALNGTQTVVEEMVAEFDRRRQPVLQVFSDIPGVSLVRPTGAFYAFPNLSKVDTNSEELALNLLRQAGVAVVPGKAFGDFGEGHIRIAFSCSLADVHRGLNAIKNYCRAALAAST